MLILASASPRRRELLGLITEDFRVVTAQVDETISGRMSPRRAVEDLACRKAKAVALRYPAATVIGADTIVVLDDEILGKPTDAADARRMLKALSGREHCVYTGVAVLSPEGSQVFSECTAVTFVPLSDEMIRAYTETDEPFDKAGAYGIQGKGALFVSGIAGDYYNVMGLPVCRLNALLARMGENEKKL